MKAVEAEPGLCADKHRPADDAASGFILDCCMLWHGHSKKPLPRKVKRSPGTAKNDPETAKWSPSLYRFVVAAMPPEVLDCEDKDISKRINTVLNERAHPLLNIPGYPLRQCTRSILE